jgi:hypothetical protein
VAVVEEEKEEKEVKVVAVVIAVVVDAMVLSVGEERNIVITMVE